LSIFPFYHWTYYMLATYTNEGVGACGFTSTNDQLVVGVSSAFFNNFP
jgi:hypothetical protein